jgi:hypothetical protein
MTLSELPRRYSIDGVGVDDQRIRHLRHHDDRLEFGRIEAELRVQVLVDHKWWRRRREQGVAVRRRLISLFGADVAGGPRAVFDYDRLAPFA